MALQATKQRLLRKAAVLMGTDELAIRMKVPPDLLDAWINGRVTMPDRKLVLLANVLDQFSTKP
jgi:hypothetical protein